MSQDIANDDSPADAAREAARRIGRLEARLTRPQALRNLALAGCLGVFALVSALLYFAGRVHAFALVACLLLFAPMSLLVALSTLYQYFDRRPTLLLDADGLHHVLLGSVAWPEVVGICLTAVPGRNDSVPILAIGLVPGARMIGGAPWVRARGSNFRISLQGLSEAPADVLAMAEVLRDRVAPPRLQAWYPGMSRQKQAMYLENQRLLAGFERLAPTGRPRSAVDETELHQLTKALEANSAGVAQTGQTDARRFRRRLWLLKGAMVLAVLLAAWRLWTLAS
jgi:hypothetical protein